MTNIPAITTNVVKTAAQTAATAQGTAPGAAAGMFGGVPGMNFMDMIFARPIGTQATATTDTPVLKAPVVVHPSFATNTPALATPQIAMPGTDEASLITPDMLADGLGMEEINALLAKLTGAPEQNAKAATSTITTDAPPPPLSGKQKEDILKVIATLLQGQPQQAAMAGLDQAMGDPSLVATPLTPALLTEIVEKMQTGSDAVALIGNLVRIVPPAAAVVTAKPGKTGPDMMAAIASETEDKPENNIINPLLTLALPEGETVPGDDAALAARMNALTPGADQSAGLAGLKAALQPGTPAPAGTGNEYINNAVIGGKSTPAAASGSSFTGTQGTDLDSLLNSAGWESIYPDGLEWTQQPGGVAHANLSLTGPASFASLVTQAHTASTPHPATQIVAATLTKAASDGETKSMTLKLDPPELGRLEIRMDFAKEKGMKAHIVVEKHETYMMMQRDAHVLERALQDAGIGAEGGLSFELAQDGGLFDDGHQGGNRHGGGSGGKADGEAEAIIETTMNWSVDANGMTRYDLLV